MAAAFGFVSAASLKPDAPESNQDGAKTIMNAANTFKDAANTIMNAANTIEDAANSTEDAANSIDDAANSIENAAKSIKDTAALAGSDFDQRQPTDRHAYDGIPPAPQKLEVKHGPRKGSVELSNSWMW